MTRRAALLLLALTSAVSALNATSVQNLSGKWEGTFIITANGQQVDDVVEMALAQKGSALTGTVGPNVDLQWAIVAGKVDGTKVTIDAEADGTLVKFTLVLVDGRLKGDAVTERNGQTMKAKVDVGRSKWPPVVVGPAT